MSRSLIFLLLVSLVMFSSCSPGYVMRGAWEEFRILSKREKIQDLLDENTLNAENKEKLALVLKIREFASSKGLNVGKSYSQFAEVDNSSLVWVLTAAPKLSLQPRTWWFPIVGTVPYKGFFSKDDAIALKNKFEAEGDDVFVRSSNAFSTLGWFNDPVLSTMLKGDEISLSDIILHEILHRTIWIPGSVEFNESLANFVGATLAEEYFFQLGDFARSRQAAQRKAEELAFGRLILDLSEKLEATYEGHNSDEEKFRLKESILESGRKTWNERGPSPHYSLEKFPLNNASLLSLRAYLRGLDDLQFAYDKCSKDMGKFIALLKGFEKSSTEELFLELKRVSELKGC